MGSDVSTQNGTSDIRDPPTPSTVRSFAPDDSASATRNPPIDPSVAADARGGGRFSRFFSDALPGSKISGVKAPIPQEIHVVREGSVDVAPTVEQDPDMRHLMSLPSFQPIMKASAHLPTSSRDQEIGDRLDYRKILMIGLRYQQYLRQCSDLVATEQQNVIASVREVEHDLFKEVAILNERQKQMSKYVDTFNTIPDINRTLEKIDQNLSKTIDAMDGLNTRLPAEYQMPPFRCNE